MADSDQTLAVPLVTEEESSSFNEHHHEIQQEENFDESDSEYFDMLLDKETDFPFIKNEKCYCFKRARLDAIRWILDTRKLFEFRHMTAYLSVLYFDRFFSRRAPDHDRDLAGVRIASLACLSLAARMGESAVREVSDYNVNGYSFEVTELRKMESLVLTTLDEKMRCVTPYDYLDFFVNRLFQKFRQDEEELFTRVDELILGVMGEINVAEQRPSVVAAAAVLVVYDQRVMTIEDLEIKMNGVPSWGSVETEHLFSCYKLMQRILQAKSNAVYSFFWAVINFFKLRWNSLRFNHYLGN